MKRDSSKKLTLVFDSSVIVEIIELDLIEALKNRRNMAKERLVIPSLVQIELNHPNVDESLRTAVQRLIEEGLFEVIEPSREIAEELRFVYRKLGDGEIGTLALSLEIGRNSRDVMFPLLDDKLARTVARELGLEVHGTLWLILELKKGLLLAKENAIRITKELRQHGFRISERELSNTIAEIERDC